jgi:hypothetical protein
MFQLLIRTLLPAVLTLLIPLLPLASAEGVAIALPVGVSIEAEPEVGFDGAEIPNIRWRKSRDGHSWEAEGSLGPQQRYLAVATQGDDETLALFVRIQGNGQDRTVIRISQLAGDDEDEDTQEASVYAVIGDTRCFLWLAGESKYHRTSNQAWRKEVLDLLDDVDYDFTTLAAGLEWLDSLEVWQPNTGGVGATWAITSDVGISADWSVVGTTFKF